MGGSKSKEYAEDISDSESDSDEYFNGREPIEVQHLPIDSMDNRKNSMRNNKCLTLHHETEHSNVEQDKVVENAGTSTEDGIATDNTVDALARNITMPKAEDVLNLEAVQQIETNLEEYEEVSLIFLLCSSENVCQTVNELNDYLQTRRKLDSALAQGEIHLLKTWAMREDIKQSKWQLKLVEALCIIQNYQVLRQLGYSNKTDLNNRFLPQSGFVSESIDKTRKTFYLIAEKLDDEKTTIFLDYMLKEFYNSNLLARAYHTDYLELYFLAWEGNHDSQKISKMIKKTLKLMDMEILGDGLVITEEEEAPHVTSHTKVKIDKESSGKSLEIFNGSRGDEEMTVLVHENLESSIPLKERNKRFKDTVHGYEGGQYYEASASPSVSMVRRSNSENCYDIDEHRPGKLLLINQKYFHTEVDPRYKMLLHPSNSAYKLETRVGTEIDRDRLISVFKNKFKFYIQLEENLPHYKLVEVITAFVESTRDESSLFVCILSHGDKGVIYGSNSCKVPIEKIEKIMVGKNKAHLQGKPKVLILQSCQGLYCQKMEDDLDDDDDEDAELYTRDGASDPRSSDLLKFYSTIPGYASVRNMVRGSWFIQALCNAIEDYHQSEHLLDICVRVNNMVSAKKWREENEGTNIMMPMLVHTFRKHFYFRRQ